MRHILKHGGEQEKLLRAAERVRDAKLRVFDAEKAKEPPCEGPRGRSMEKIERECQEWTDMPLEEIIARCKNHRISR